MDTPEEVAGNGRSISQPLPAPQDEEGENAMTFEYDTDNQEDKLTAGTIERILDWVVFESRYDEDRYALCMTFLKFLPPGEMIQLFSRLYQTRIRLAAQEEQANRKEQANQFLEIFLDSCSTPSQEALVQIKAFLQAHAPASAIRHKVQWLEHRGVLDVQRNQTLDRAIAEGFSASVRGFFQIPDRVAAYLPDGLLRFSEEELAQTLTVLEAHMFNQITVEQLLFVQDPVKAPSVAAFARHFNHVVLWLATEVMAAVDISRQLQLVRKIILMGQQCLEMGNLNGVMEVLCALNKAPLQKLSKMWESLSPALLQSLKQLEDEMSPLRNFHRYRQRLRNSVHLQPVVPYMAAHLKDLTFADDGNPYYLSNGLLNFEKIQIVGRIIHVIMQCQKKKFAFPVQEEILHFFCNTWQLSESDFQAALLFHEPKKVLLSLDSSAEPPPQWDFHPEELNRESPEGVEALYQIATHCLLDEHSVAIGDRIWAGRAFYQSFSGIDFASVLISRGVSDTKKGAREIGQWMIEEGLLLGMTSEHFVVRHDAFYQFVTEEVPGYDKSSYVAASAIEDTQEREDRYYFLALAHTANGGVACPRLWNNMTTWHCCTGAALHQWCAQKLEMTEDVRVAFLQRLLEQKLLSAVPVPSLPVEKMVLDREDRYYQLHARRPRRIKKPALLHSGAHIVHVTTDDASLDSLEADGSRAGSSKRNRRSSTPGDSAHTLLPPAGRQNKKKKKIMKLSFSNIHKVESTLNEEEIRLLTQLMKPETGVEIEAVVQLKNITASIFKGSAVIAWLTQHYSSTPEQALELAESLYQRKVIRSYSHGGPMQDSDLLFHFGRRYLAYCKRERGVIITPRDLQRVRKREALRSGSGPVLFERNPGQGTTTQSHQRLLATYEAIALLAELCHPSTGLKRSELSMKNETQFLFSGHSFVQWLRERRSMTDGEGRRTFDQFAARGLLIGSNHVFPVQFDPQQMYRFVIEPSDGAFRSPSFVPLQLGKVQTNANLAGLSSSPSTSPRSASRMARRSVTFSTMSRDQIPDMSSRPLSASCDHTSPRSPLASLHEETVLPDIPVRSVVEEVIASPKEEKSSSSKSGKKGRMRRLLRTASFSRSERKLVDRSLHRRRSQSDVGVVLSREQLEEVFTRMIGPYHGVPLQSKRVKKKMRLNCFSGEDVVQWLRRNHVALFLEVPNMNELDIAQQLFTSGYIIGIHQRQLEDSASAFYQFPKNLPTLHATRTQ